MSGRLHEDARTAAALSLLSATASAVTIDPRDAAAHVGETVTVEGMVAAVVTDPGSRVTFLDFGGSYPNMVFTAVIFGDHAAKFPGVASLSGRVVDVTGVIRLHHNNPEIILNSADQLQAR